MRLGSRVVGDVSRDYGKPYIDYVTTESPSHS